jgi:hypothetical protein
MGGVIFNALHNGQMFSSFILMHIDPFLRFLSASRFIEMLRTG